MYIYITLHICVQNCLTQDSLLQPEIKITNQSLPAPRWQPGTTGPAVLLGRRRRGSLRDGAWLVAALCSVLLYITVNKINEHIFSHYIQSRSQYIMAIISYLAHRLVPGQSLLSTPSFFPTACFAVFRTGLVPCRWRGVACRAWGRCG